MTLPDNILTPIGNLRGQLTSGGLIPGVPVIIGEASGSVVKIPDGSNNQFYSFNGEIGAAGYTEGKLYVLGQNVFDFEKQLQLKGVTYSKDSEGWITINSILSPNLFQIRLELPVEFTASSTLFIHPDTVATNFRIRVYDANNQFKEHSQLNNPPIAYINNMPTKYIGFDWSSGGSVKIKLQVVADSVYEPTYIPYDDNSTVYTIDWSDLGSISNSVIIIDQTSTKIVVGSDEYVRPHFIYKTLEGYNTIVWTPGIINDIKYFVDVSTFLQWVYDNLYNP